MAELTHFYDEENTLGSRTAQTWSNIVTVGSNPAEILGSALTANTKYLIIARALVGGNNVSQVAGFRVDTADDSTIATKSEMVLEPQQTADTELVSYMFVHSYITDTSPANIHFQIFGAGSGAQAKIDQSSLCLLDLDALDGALEVAYFDASDAGPTDSGADWTDDANAFDGNFSTFAVADSTGTLSGEGTTASTSGDTIGEVWARLTYRLPPTQNTTIDIDEDSVGGTNLASVTLEATGGAIVDGSVDVKLTAPSGGWTWQKVNDLALSIDSVGGGARVYGVEVRVYGLGGRTYVEDAQPDSGDEYATTASTTVLAEIPEMIDTSTLLETVYFDASDAGPTDASASWSNDSQAFNGNDANSAVADSGTSVMSGDGTTASTSGDTIGLVQVRAKLTTTTNTTVNIRVREDSDVGAILRDGLIQSGTALTAEYIPWEEVDAPSGGWTWQKVNDLSLSLNRQNTTDDPEVFIVEVRVFGEDVFPETLILGSARADIGSTGRWFRHDLVIQSTARNEHQAEGEDTAEQRIVGFAAVHPGGSAANNAVTIYGREEAASGNMLDGGAYLIALPTKLFADVVWDYVDGGITVDGTETTIATTGSYTPTIQGNHLIFGRTHGVNTPTQLGGMWVESGTTEIRTGDSTPTHNQIWDNTKDDEQMATFQRYSITTAETFNLRAQGAGSDFDLNRAWIIAVNLSPPPSAATDFPPFLHRPPRHVRM